MVRGGGGLAVEHLIGLPVETVFTRAELRVVLLVKIRTERVAPGQLRRADFRRQAGLTEEEDAILRWIGRESLEHQAVVRRLRRFGIGHEQADFRVLPLDRFDEKRSAPRGEARRERNVSAQTFGHRHGVVGEQSGEGLVEKLALRTKPTAGQRDQIFHAEQLGRLVSQPERDETPTQPTGNAGRIKKRAGFDDVVRVRRVAGFTPAPLDKAGQAIEDLRLGQLEEVDLSAEKQLLRERVAGTVLAIRNPEEDPPPGSAQGDPVVGHERPRPQPISGDPLAVPPPGQGLLGRWLFHRRRIGQSSPAMGRETDGEEAGNYQGRGS